MANEKLSGIVYPPHQKRVFTEDWQKEQSSVADEITQRFNDALGSGIVTGGAVAVGVTSATVDLTEKTVAYDANGRRIEAPITSGISLPTNVTVKLVARHKFNSTDHTSPDNDDTAPYPITYLENSYEVIARQGSLDPNDVPLKEISIDPLGVVTLGRDLRTWCTLKPENISDGSITSEKLHADSQVGLKSELATAILSEISGDFSIIKALNALEKVTSYRRRLLGELFTLDDRKDPSSDFPALCVSKPDTILNSTDWPDLVTHFYNKPLRHNPCTSNTTEFDIISWQIASNVVTLTFANATPEKSVLASLAVDRLVHGSYNNWRTITLPEAIGTIPAGTYTITDLVSTDRTISFPYAAADGSGNITKKAIFYQHRIAGLTTQVRHFQDAGRSFFTVGTDRDGEWIGGLRKPDQFQAWKPFNTANTFVNNYWTTGGSGNARSGNASYAQGFYPAGKGDPRYGYHTRSNGSTVFAYRWGVRFTG